MVGHCRFLLTEEKKAEMEEGGGTKESTKVMRKTIGANFQQYVEEREAWWCGDPREAASWWTPPHSWISNGRQCPLFLHSKIVSHCILLKFSQGLPT